MPTQSRLPRALLRHLAGSATLAALAPAAYAQSTALWTNGTASTANWNDQANWFNGIHGFGQTGALVLFNTTSITGTLTFTATPLHPFTIYLQTLDGANQPAALANFTPALSRSFRLASFSAGIVGFDPAAIQISTSGFLSPHDGTWSVALNGSQLDLRYTAAIPEPSTFALLASLASVAGIACRRRRRHRQTPAA